MTQLSPIRAESPSELECRACGTPMRLFGIESHPGISGVNLESYVCPRCDGVQTVAVPAIRRKGKSKASNGPARHAAAFDAETTRLLGAVFDAAWENVLASWAPISARDAAAIRESLAKQIIEMVSSGERDFHRLVREAVRCARASAVADGLSTGTSSLPRGLVGRA
jgi:hypothetical protein